MFIIWPNKKAKEQKHKQFYLLPFIFARSFLGRTHICQCLLVFFTCFLVKVHWFFHLVYLVNRNKPIFSYSLFVNFWGQLLQLDWSRWENLDGVKINFSQSNSWICLFPVLLRRVHIIIFYNALFIESLNKTLWCDHLNSLCCNVKPSWAIFVGSVRERGICLHSNWDLSISIPMYNYIFYFYLAVQVVESIHPPLPKRNDKRNEKSKHQ